MDKESLRKGCVELVRELCRLIDSGFTLDRTRFHELCEQERFIDYLLIEFKGNILLDYLDKQSGLCEQAVLNDMNSALSRHANAVVMEDYRLKGNAYLLAVNIAVAVMQEVNQVEMAA